MASARRTTLNAVLLAALMLVVPGGAPDRADAGGSAGHGGAADEATLFNAPRQVDIPIIIAPVHAEGRLEGYAYLSIQLEVLGADVWAVREKIPFIQDALLRDVFRSAIARKADMDTLDLEALGERLALTANAVLGSPMVKDIIFKTTAFIGS